ncbi:MAG: 4-hydroxy-tetrahydrodipicolinate reductase [Flavobacteriia bacterium]|nr:MAG: 4-hydroxy-tetrahydrodipicolinate reductase [Flavobacteriia bacterium]
MNIILLGYGKMGRAIEQIALDRGHSIVAKIDEPTDVIDFKNADVAIDFSLPDAAFSNISQALTNNIPVVSGTTGWLDRYDEAVALCQEHGGSFLYASNFSPGVNLFFKLNKYLAKLIQPYDYKPLIEETHHIHKLDAPSGTAITLAEQLLIYADHMRWVSIDSDKAPEEGLPIKSIRKDEVTGTHEITYRSEIDSISIKHEAHNRSGFALGAVLAAEYIADKKGIFTMSDVLGLDSLD